MDEKIKPSQRQYPVIYEKMVPIALVAIGLAVLVLMVITLGVIFNLF